MQTNVLMISSYRKVETTKTKKGNWGGEKYEERETGVKKNWKKNSKEI